MISIQQFQQIFADALFSGNTEIAGILMYTVVLAIVFALTKKDFHVGILVSLPLTLVFRLMGVLSTEVALLLIVIAVLALAMSAKRSIG